MKLGKLRPLIVSVVLSSFAAMLCDDAKAADDRYWIDPNGGDWDLPSNWSETPGGPSGASMPGVDDRAIFELNNTYTVSFPFTAAPTSARLDVDTGNVTFDLQGRIFTVPVGIRVGDPGETGRVTFLEGIVDVGDEVLIGAGATSEPATGFLTITTGRLIGSPDVTVGERGDGTLTINNGGDLIAHDTTIGSLSRSNGTATLSGTGSTWTNSNLLYVGLNGNGALTVSNGGLLTSSESSIAVSPSSVSSVTVTSAGSAWNNSSSLTVGGAGEGTLNVRSGGTVSTDALIIGEQSGSQGRLEIDGAGSHVASQDVYVGYGGSGILEVTSGGRLDTCTAGTCNLGSGVAFIGNGGAARVSGTGSTWAMGALNVGFTGSGTATLTVENGAHVEMIGGLLFISNPFFGLGTVNFRGGSITAQDVIRQGTFNWTDGTLTIDSGYFDNNGHNLMINGADADDLPTLHLARGGFLSGMGSLLTIGYSRQGAVIMSGTGSPIQQLRTDVGAIDGGSGVLSVTNGAQFTATGDLNLGGTDLLAGGSGTLNVDAASTVVVNNNLRLWPGGTINVNGGTLKFDLDRLHRNGGKINFSAGRIIFPDEAELFDARLDTLLGPTHELGVGRTIHYEQGDVEFDGSLNITGGTLSGDALYIFGGVLNLDSGQVAMSNEFNNSGRIFVNTGRLAAGSMVNTGEIHLAGPTATIAIAGLDNHGLLAGSGRVDALFWNFQAGEVRVGPGERLSFRSGPHFNDGLIDLNGGTIEFHGLLVNNLDVAATGLIAARNGTLRFHGGVTNTGSIVMSTGVMDVFGDINNDAGPTVGRIVVSGGGTANFYDDITNGGSINVSAAGTLKSTAVFFGSLSGNGVGGAGNVFIEGDARPGFSPGVMSFGGDVAFGPFASVAIELAGTTAGTQHDQLTIAGAVSFGGTLDVDLIGNFTPVANNQFVLATYNSRVGMFDSVHLPDLPPTLNWSLTYGTNQLLLSTTLSLLPGDIDQDGDVDRTDAAMFSQYFGRDSDSVWITGDFNADGLTTLADWSLLQSNFGQPAAGSAVPEPATAWLAIIGAATILWRVRRQQRRAQKAMNEER